jgi:hypothetical protein
MPLAKLAINNHDLLITSISPFSLYIATTWSLYKLNLRFI